ncbi:hypothetical protein Tco_0522388 [Tanacetum coccineum]
MAEYASEKLLELEPKHPGGYVFLSNVYVGVGMWQDVEKIPNKIKNKVKIRRDYMPETEWVLHNIEEREKEDALGRHSEKLALTFALIFDRQFYYYSDDSVRELHFSYGVSVKT